MLKNKENLIDAAYTGNKQAILQLLTICQPDIKRFARRTCSTSDDAEDAVQIVLWQLYRKIGTLNTIAAFTSWLFRIVERTCYHLFKTRLPTTNKYNELDIENAASPATDIDLQLDLTKHIIALPIMYREVFIMRDIEEFTTPEVAKKIGISIEAVKSRLHRARSMIKEQLNAQGYFHS